MKRDLQKKGYSKEEEYFHKLNQELLEKLKNKEKTEKEKTESDKP